VSETVVCDAPGSVLVSLNALQRFDNDSFDQPPRFRFNLCEDCASWNWTVSRGSQGPAPWRHWHPNQRVTVLAPEFERGRADLRIRSVKPRQAKSRPYKVDVSDVWDEKKGKPRAGAEEQARRALGARQKPIVCPLHCCEACGKLASDLRYHQCPSPLWPAFTDRQQPLSSRGRAWIGFAIAPARKSSRGSLYARPQRGPLRADGEPWYTERPEPDQEYRGPPPFPPKRLLAPFPDAPVGARVLRLSVASRLPRVDLDDHDQDWEVFGPFGDSFDEVELRELRKELPKPICRRCKRGGLDAGNSPRARVKQLADDNSAWMRQEKPELAKSFLRFSELRDATITALETLVWNSHGRTVLLSSPKLDRFPREPDGRLMPLPAPLEPNQWPAGEWERLTGKSPGMPAKCVVCGGSHKEDELWNAGPRFGAPFGAQAIEGARFVGRSQGRAQEGGFVFDDALVSSEVYRGGRRHWGKRRRWTRATAETRAALSVLREALEAAVYGIPRERVRPAKVTPMLSDRELIAHGYATFTLADTLGQRDRRILASLVRGADIKAVADSFGLDADTIRNMPAVVALHRFIQSSRTLAYLTRTNGHGKASLRKIAENSPLGRERIRQFLGEDLHDEVFEVDEWIWTLPDEDQERVCFCLYRWLVVKDSPRGYPVIEEDEQQRIAEKVAGRFLGYA
jgi:hypothetical protein